MMIKMGDLLKFESLDGVEGLVHFTTTRHGGVSGGRYDSLNGSPYCGDSLECVMENQRRILSHLPGDSISILLPYQVHGAKVVVVDDVLLALSEEEREAKLHGVDGLLTRCRSVVVAVSTADCVPILLYDPSQNGVGAVHAGWRGTVGRIAQRSVQRMVAEWGSDPSEIRVAIAPSISFDAFEVGDEVYEAFSEKGFPMERISKRNETSGKWHMDLWEANVWQLEQVGIDRSHVSVSGLCTFTHPDDFFSARRLSIRSGRNLTGIGLL